MDDCGLVGMGHYQNLDFNMVKDTRQVYTFFLVCALVPQPLGMEPYKRSD